MADEIVVVLGGSGFVGRHVANRLVEEGLTVVVPTRRRDNATPLAVLPTIDVAVLDVNRVEDLERVTRNASAVINLIGILHSTKGESFADAHVAMASKVTAACKANGVRRLIHMSALHSDPSAPSAYLRSKGEAAKIIAASGLDWTIFEPSVIFGRGDDFLNKFAKLLHLFPVMALPGADARFQPVYVGDVVECIVTSLALSGTIGQTYQLCGPTIYTLRELVRIVGNAIGSPRPIIGLGPALGTLAASVLELVPGKPLTRDNLASMKIDSVCACPFPPIFGVVPRALESIVPTYLAPDALMSPYDVYRVRGGR